MKFELDEKLLINLCTCMRVFISLVSISCGANVNTCCRLYEVVETVPKKLCDRLTLKFVQIWLIVIGCCKTGEQPIADFVKCEGDWRLLFFHLLNAGLKKGLDLKPAKNVALHDPRFEQNCGVHLQSNWLLNKHLYVTRSGKIG